MLDIEIPLDILSSVATSGVALALGLYNFWKARRGAKLILPQFVEVGVMRTFNPSSRKEHTLLYLPTQFYNEGTKTAVVTNFKVSATSDGASYSLVTTKKVKGQTPEEMRSEYPMFPVMVGAGETVSALFEVMNKPEDLLKPGAQYTFVVYAEYVNGRTSVSEFSLEIPKEHEAKFPNITWVNLHRKGEPSVQPIMFGKDRVLV